MQPSEEMRRAAKEAFIDACFARLTTEESVDAALSAALATIKAEPVAWQSIETAPKDGTQVLGFAQGEYGENDIYRGVIQWVEKRDWIPRSVAGWFWAYAIRPTHWMPLPAAPSPEVTL